MRSFEKRLISLTREVYPYRLPLLAAAFAASIYSFSQIDVPGHIIWVFLGTAVFFCILTWKRKPLFLWIALLIFLAAFAGAITAKPHAVGPNVARGRLGEVMLEGEITLDSPAGPDSNRWIIKSGGAPAYGIRKGERISLTLNQGGMELRWGDRVRAWGELTRFQDEVSRLSGSLYCSRIERLPSSHHPIAHIVNRAREAIFHFCHQEVGLGAEGELLAGIMLGDYRQLGSDDATVLKKTGLVHVCSASGLHVGILAGLILLAGKKLSFSRRIIFLLQLSLLTLYALVTGGDSPVIRSLLVIAIAGCAHLFFADFDLLSALGLGLMAMLSWDPFWLYEVGFQLSFAAVIGIVLLSRPLQDSLGFSNNKISSLLCATLAAQLATMPIMIVHFSEVSIVSPLTNLLVLPLLPLVMMCGFMGVFLKFFQIPLSFIPGSFCRLSLNYVLAIARALGRCGWSSLFVSSIPVPVVILYYLALWVSFLYKKGRKYGLGKIFLILLAIFLALQIFLPASSGKLQERRTQLVFFDVGQGDALFLRTSSGVSILIDGGEEESVLQGKLKSYGVKRIDFMILTHPDKDHVAGLIGGLKECEVGAVMEPGIAGGRVYQRWIDEVKKEGSTQVVARAGDSYSIGDLSVQVLSPDYELTISESENNLSLVLKIVGNDFSLLVTGDIEAEEEERLLDSGANLEADILKVPHHGGYSEKNGDFFQRVKPVISVISVGEMNPYGHPSEETLDSLSRSHAQIYRTDLWGDIIIDAGPGGYEVSKRGKK